MQEILNILGSVGFNWHVALANFVNFLIILFLLNKFFFGKIGKTLDERKRVIEHGLAQAKEAEVKLTHAEEEKHMIIASAHKEKESILSRAEVDGKAMVASLQEEAKAQIEDKIKKVDNREATLKETVEKAFGEKAPELIASLYAKTLARELKEEENNALIARMHA